MEKIVAAIFESADSVILIMLGLFAAVCLYAGQKWAYKCHGELVRPNKKMDELLSQRR